MLKTSEGSKQFFPSNRTLVQILNKGLNNPNDQTIDLLSQLASETCQIRNTCELRKEGKCSIHCAR